MGAWHHLCQIKKKRLKVINDLLRFQGGFPGGSVVKSPPADVGDEGLIPGLGRSPGGRNGNLLQYSCLGSPWTEEPGGLQSMVSPKGKQLDMTSRQHKVSGQKGAVLGPELRFF